MNRKTNPIKFSGADSTTLGSNTSSDPERIRSDVGEDLFIQCNITGSPSGSLSVQGSADDSASTGFTPTHWTTLPLSNGATSVVISGSQSESTAFLARHIPVSWARLVWTAALNSTGSLSAQVSR